MISVDKYKEELVNTYRYECDNTDEKRKTRRNDLEEHTSDEMLDGIIKGTEAFIKKILSLSEKNYPGFIRIPLEEEPTEKRISLNLVGGASSDRIYLDSDGNYYSMRILLDTFGDGFHIEPCRTDFIDEIDRGEITIISEIPSYSLYIQCKKSVIDKVRREFADKRKQGKTVFVKRSK